jgi:MATE family multidrug resistance protein
VPQSRFVSEVRECLYLAVPLAAAQLAQSMTGFVDTVMMGLLGSEALAAGGLGAMTFTILLIIATGIITAVSPLVAEAYGAGNTERARQVGQQGLWLAAFLALPLTLLIWHAGSLLRQLGQAPDTVAAAETYLRAIAWGYLPGLGFAVLRSYISALSRPRPIMVIVIGGTLLNVVGNYVLIFGKLGFPKMGLAGIGWASTLSLWGMFLAAIAYILAQPSLRSYNPFTRTFRYQGKLFAELVSLGLPIGAMVGVEAGLFAVTTFLMGYLGTVPLAAHQIVLQTAAVTFNVPLGIALATTVRVGQLSGQKQVKSLQRAGFIGIGLGALFMGAMALLFWAFPEKIISLYLDVHKPENAAVVILARKLLAIAAVFQILDGIQVVAAGALRGVKDTRIPMFIAILAYWGVGLTSGCLLGFKLGLGGVGLWWGLALGLMVTAIVLPWRFFHRTYAHSFSHPL